MTPGRATRPVRDLPTVISYAQLGIYGWFLYGFGSSQALLRDEQGTSRSVQALHGTALAVGAVASGLMLTALVHRWGRGPVLRLGSFALIAGILLYTSGLPTAVTLLGAFTCSVGGGLALSAINAFLADRQGPAAPAALSEGNGIAATVGLLGPLTIGLGAAFVIGWRVGLWVVVGLLIALEIWRGPSVHRFDASHGHPDGEPGHDPGGRLPPLYRWAWALLACVVGVEFCLSLWSAELLRDRGGMGPAAAAASLMALIGGMAVGRFGGAWVVERADPERVLAATMLVALAGFAVTWGTTSPAPMLAGLAITGMGIGSQWPLGIARAVRASGGRPDRAAALSGVAVGLASGVAPFVLGALADAVGVLWAFLVVPVLLATGLAMTLLRPVPADLGQPGPAA